MYYVPKGLITVDSQSYAIREG